jgi:hypothetical protein
MLLNKLYLVSLSYMDTFRIVFFDYKNKIFKWDLFLLSPLMSSFLTHISDLFNIYAI